MNHTPGPWKVHPEMPGIVFNPLCGHIAEVCATYPARDNTQQACEVKSANAHLIAAAPDLLAACKRAKDLLVPEVTQEPDRTIFWELVAAIRKADGQS